MWCVTPSLSVLQVLKGKAYNTLMSDVWSLGVVLCVVCDSLSLCSAGSEGEGLQHPDV